MPPPAYISCFLGSKTKSCVTLRHCFLQRAYPAHSPSAIQRTKSVHVVLAGGAQVLWEGGGAVVTLSLRAMIISRSEDAFSSEVTHQDFGPSSQALLELQESVSHCGM